MSPYEKGLAHLCYEYFKKTGLTEFTYQPKNGNDLVHAANAIDSMKEDGYISDVVDNGFSYSFVIEDSLIHYMEQEES